MKWIFTVFILPFLVYSQTINLRKTAYLPRGALYDNYTRVKVFDANNNNKNDLIFQGAWTEGTNGFAQVFFYQCNDYDTYILRDSIYVCTDPSFYDIGYLDNDSLTDAIIQCNLGGVYSYEVVFESPDYYSYPTQIVWQWRYEFNGGSVAPSIISDLDRDGKMDFLTVDCYVIYVFENTTNNQYQKVWWDTLKDNSAIGAVGDYDLDGRMEFVTGTPLGWISVYECIGNDRYIEVFVDTLPEPAPYDIWTGNDLDGAANPKF